ncbi:long-chain fatty acid--CoA ligase [Streptosporangiaceae bacterium NEAU-GS5]|nr:long-chain fatty acid--CoA ligase [Streptosporangiaceae bacterium NEAU-GS5]
MRNQGLGSWPARRARISPGGAALLFEGTALSYQDVHERVTRLAYGLRGLGIRRGDRVAYLGPNHPALLETLFACAALGALFVPLNFRLSPPELEFILADCGAALLVRADGQPSLPIRTVMAGEVAEDGPPLDEPVGLDDPCMIMYTSGTTGRPKGAVLSHGNLTWNCVNVLLDLDLRRDEVTLISAPMFHAAALNMTCLPTFLKGGTAVVMPAFTPESAFELIAKHRVTWMFGVPTMFAAMTRSPSWPSADLSSVRILECGGAPVPEALIRAYRERGLTFLQGYGMTEAAPGALFLGPEAADRVGSAGKASFFTDVRLGESGEIQIHGPNVIERYWNQAVDLTDDAWFRSGDVGRIDEDGYFYVVDRIKDMFVSGGENVYPAEVEAALFEDPAVADCAVIGVPDDTWGEVGKAFVVPRSSPDPGALLAGLRGRLAGYKVPKYVEFVDAIPRNGAGKALKHRLREESS